MINSEFLYFRYLQLVFNCLKLLTKPALVNSASSEAVDELTKHRLLWWEKGIFHPQARWEQAK